MTGSPPSADFASASAPPATTSVPTVAARPSLCMKPTPVTTAVSPGPSAGSPTGIGSLTSKEWVVPPRPKPGRKPATDTPPTKRKAQNRAAQRAFRERRAARVGELEEQIKQVEEDHDQQQDALKSHITRLEREVDQYRTELSSWIERYRQLEKEVSSSRSLPPIEVPLSPQQRQRQLPLQPHAQSDSHQQLHQHDDDAIHHSVGCGNCTLDAPCQCIDDVVNAINASGKSVVSTQFEKRPSSPSQATSQKRIKREVMESMEIDFTSMYSRPRATDSRAEAVSPTPAVADPCGFCQDGTPCICAEMAAEQERQSNNPTPAGRQLAQFTPPPSEGDVAPHMSVGPPRAIPGPGTCAQCRADPNSTLFCKSLAAARVQAGLPSGCCGGKGSSGGCCQDSVPLPTRNTRSKTMLNKVQLPPLQGPRSSITLSCADAYTTLSRHPAYERASGEIANWMPKLHANPNSVEGRPALEIDAANVMAVLRDFDRRFGAEK